MRLFRDILLSVPVIAAANIIPVMLFNINFSEFYFSARKLTRMLNQDLHFKVVFLMKPVLAVSFVFRGQFFVQIRLTMRMTHTQWHVNGVAGCDVKIFHGRMEITHL